MGNAPSAAQPAGGQTKHKSVEQRNKKREEVKQKKPAPVASKKRQDAVIVSAGRVETKKDVPKKEAAKAAEPESKAADSHKGKKNEKEAFVCNWIDRMDNQRPFDPQELAVNGVD